MHMYFLSMSEQEKGKEGKEELNCAPLEGSKGGK